MTKESGSNREGGQVACTREDCHRNARFWTYHSDDGRWQPLCKRHTRRLHPSLEVTAWLESGYARPVELGRPDGLPGAPPGGRPAAFREVVDRAMGWD